jgi:hypothetical protein
LKMVEKMGGIKKEGNWRRFDPQRFKFLSWPWESLLREIKLRSPPLL